MKHSWTQPSLSRDFALLSASVLFVLCIISTWVTYATYTAHVQAVTADLEKESKQLETAIAMQMDDASYMLSSLGKQIVLEPDHNLTRLAQMLKSFDKKDYRYSILTWINPESQMEVSSNRGVLEKPVDISDRDFVKMAAVDPWKMVIGQPIEGRVSGRWVIPVALGITDYTGKFIGTVAISIDIKVLTDQLAQLSHQPGLNFTIADKKLVPITQAPDAQDTDKQPFPIRQLENVNLSKNPSGLLARSNLFWEIGNYYYYRVSPNFPYAILLSYDAQYSDENVKDYLWYRLLQMVAMGVFFVLFLWITRVRMIKPVMEMTRIASEIARGKSFELPPSGGPVEIETFAVQLRKVSDYIAENKRIESELRHKVFQFMKAKELAEAQKRSQFEFLAYICQDIRTPLNSIVGDAQVMKDQMHGPMENRKYRQYVTDIFNTGTSLMHRTQDIISLAKLETGYLDLVVQPIDITEVINKSVRFISDKMQVEKLGIKIQLPEPVPRLMSDEFRLQQILTNLLSYASDHAQPEGIMTLEALFINEPKDKGVFVFIIGSHQPSPHKTEALLEMAEELLNAQLHHTSASTSIFSDNHSNIGLELARILVEKHEGAIDITESPNGSVTIMVFFPGNRVRFMDNSK